MITVTVCTDHFETMAKGVMLGARMPGLAEAGLAILPHPLAELQPDAVAQRAEALLPRIEQLLGLTAAA